MMVLYEADLSRRLQNEFTLMFYLRISIGPVILFSYIYLGEILDFTINFISSTFRPLEVLVDASQAWWFMSWSGVERRSGHVFLQASWLMKADGILKASHV